MIKKLLFLIAVVLTAFQSWGQTNIIPTRTDVAGFIDWTDTNVTGTTYLQLLTATSSTVTPAMDFTLYSTETLNFKARTYGGTNIVENEVFIAVSTDNGTNWTDIGSRIPTSSTLTTMTSFDLSSYNGIQIKVKFYVKGTNSIGVGIDDISITGALILPTITTSVTELTDFTYAEGSGPSAEHGFTVEGSNLTADITVTPPADYEISTGSGASFVATNPITLTPISGTVSTTVIYARLKAGLTAGTYNLENIVCSSTNATDANIACSGTVASLNTADWCNYQWPYSISFDEGQVINFYARVYEPGITDSPGQGTGITAWIGYSTTNSDPSTWTNWIEAFYFGDDGANNDEYSMNFVGLTPGTYYFASRFQIETGPYQYGGTGGIWNNDNATVTINSNVVDWGNLQFPGSGTITQGDSYDVFARVYEPGTESNSPLTGINVWIGVSTTDTDPATWTTWIPATYNADSGNNDEYTAEIGSALFPGTYYYASRFQKDGSSEYRYGGYNVGGGGFWDGSTNVNGVLTVNYVNPCQELFFSEYVEGSSNNKYLEIYNPTALPVDLSDYEVLIYPNGATTANTPITLSGTLLPYDVYVIANTTAVLPVIYDIQGSLSYNGDDAIALHKISTDINVDIIGQIGFDPGNEWTGSMCTIGTQDGTLVRRASVQAGDSNGTDAFNPDMEWDCYPNDTVLGLGFHVSSCVAECLDVPAVYVAGQWLNGVTPTSNSLTFIKDNLSLPGNTGMCSLSIKEGSILTVPNGTTLTVTNGILNEGTLVIENGGSLLQLNNAVNGGTGVYEFHKTTRPYVEYDYTYWSSPVQATTVGDVFTTNSTLSAGSSANSDPFSNSNYIFTNDTSVYADSNNDTFDDDQNNWVVAAQGDVMTAGKGYIAMGAGADMPFNMSDMATGLEQNVIFKGLPNNGDIAFAVVTDADNGDTSMNQNLIGNPYPSAIDIKKLFADNNTVLGGTFYFWTHDSAISNTNPGPGAYNFTNDDYATATTDGSIFNAVTGGSAGTSAPEFIASGQGFFADMTNAGTVTFTNAQRVAGSNDVFLRKTNAPLDRMWLNLTGENQIFRQVLVGFYGTATDGYDKGLDGYRLINGNNADFYSVMPEKTERMAIQILPAFEDSKTVALGMELVDSGTYTISVAKMEGVFNTGQKVYLEDKYLNTTHDFTDGSYTFNATAGDNINNRFVVKFKTGNALNTTEFLNNVTIYPNPSKDIFYINLNSEKAMNVEVFDLTGKRLNVTVTSNMGNNYILDMSQYKPGIYLAKISSDHQQVTRKLVVE